jgi:hypothetical protein
MSIYSTHLGRSSSWHAPAGSLSHAGGPRSGAWGSVLAAVVAIPLAHAAPPVSARPITFAFTGEVGGVLDIQHFIYPELVHTGSPFTGSFTFESTTPNATPDDPYMASYEYAIIDFEAQLGSLPLEFSPTTTNNGIDVGNDYPRSVTLYWDTYAVDLPFEIMGRHVEGGIGLIDATASAWDTFALPEVPPLLENFESEHWFVFNVYGQGLIVIDGQINSLTLVPEPTTAAMVGLGAVALLAQGGRRRRYG